MNINNVFTAISSLFQNIEVTLKAANLLDESYAKDIGCPEYHPQDITLKPIDLSGTAETAVKAVINNTAAALAVAGLYAADTAANLIAAYRNGLRITDQTYIDALISIDDNVLDEYERFVAKNLANATWRTMQPAIIELLVEDGEIIGVKPPFSKITRPSMLQFNELPPDEEDKDIIQVQEGARFILSWIEKNC